MKPQRYRAWVRLLCAVALSLGLTGASAAAAASTDSLHGRPAISQIHGAVHDVVPTTARASLALSHHVGRHIPATIGSALLAAAVLVSVRILASRRRVRSTSGSGRRTSTAGARAPPVAIGI